MCYVIYLIYLNAIFLLLINLEIVVSLTMKNTIFNKQIPVSDVINQVLPLFSFGVLGDPQYVDADDGTNFEGTKIRRYRQSLQILSQACDSFDMQSTACNIILGDCVDGKAGILGIQDRCLQEILDLTVTKASDKWHFVLGNHEYYCFDRETIMNKMIPLEQKQHCDPAKLYYDFTPSIGYRFIVLDGYEISKMGGASVYYKEYAEALLCAKNPNYASGSNKWFQNMSKENSRYCPYNGAISVLQLEWLQKVLDKAMINNEKCIIFCHMPIYEKCSNHNNLLWNSEELLLVLQKCSNVVAFMAGHDHDGGYAIDESGIHHIIPPAPLECDPQEVAYGLFQVFEDHIKLNWTGKKPKKTYWPSSLTLKRNKF